MTAGAWITLAVVVVAIALLVRDRFNPTVVMGGAVLTLYLSGVVDQGQLLGGFANESLVVVAALYILAGAADITGAFEGFTSRLLGRGTRVQPHRELLRTCAPASAASAFIANTPLVAMLAPRVIRWCRRTGRSPSRYLMPLSYAVILGGSTTMIGTSTNLFVNDLIAKAGLGRLSLFSVTGIGLPLAVGGVLLMVVVGPRLLRERPTPGESLAGTEREFTMEMVIPPDSELAGATVAEAGLRNLEGVFLVEVERRDKVIAAIGPDEVLTVGDRLVFVGNFARVLDLQRMSGLVSSEARHFDHLARNPQRQFVEAVIGAGSPLVGSSLKASGFRRRYGSAVVAIHRSGEQLKGKLGEERLRVGAVLLVLAGPAFSQRFQQHRDFAIVAPLNWDRPIRREHAGVVELSILALVVVAGTGLLGLLEVSLLIAFGLVAARIVTLEDARRSIDLNVLLLMATSFALGARGGKQRTRPRVGARRRRRRGPAGQLRSARGGPRGHHASDRGDLPHGRRRAHVPHRDRHRGTGRAERVAVRRRRHVRLDAVVSDAHRLSDQHDRVGDGRLSLHRFRAVGCTPDRAAAARDPVVGADLLPAQLNRLTTRRRTRPPATRRFRRTGPRRCRCARPRAATRRAAARSKPTTASAPKPWGHPRPGSSPTRSRSAPPTCRLPCVVRRRGHGRVLRVRAVGGRCDAPARRTGDGEDVVGAERGFGLPGGPAGARLVGGIPDQRVFAFLGRQRRGSRRAGTTLTATALGFAALGLLPAVRHHGPTDRNHDAEIRRGSPHRPMQAANHMSPQRSRNRL